MEQNVLLRSFFVSEIFKLNKLRIRLWRHTRFLARNSLVKILHLKNLSEKDHWFALNPKGPIMKNYSFYWSFLKKFMVMSSLLSEFIRVQPLAYEILKQSQYLYSVKLESVYLWDGVFYASNVSKTEFKYICTQGYTLMLVSPIKCLW